MPPLAAWLGGVPLGEYLRFPLIERSWDPLPFQPRSYWIALSLASALMLIPAWLGLKHPPPADLPELPQLKGRLPRWVWTGLVCLLSGFALGKTGLAHVGVILAGVGLLLLINADSLRRSGHCLMTERPVFFLSLFPAGVVTGWLMHYLNLFLQNWTYPGYSDFGLFLIAAILTLKYALLLPLLLSLRQWLASHPFLLRRLTHGQPIPGSGSAEQGWILLGLGAAGLAGVGIWPDRIYPLSWFAPLSLALGLSLIAGKPGLFAGVRHGDWSRIVLTGLAALLLGAWDLAWETLFGPSRSFALSMLQGPSVLGLPLPAFTQFAIHGLIGLWVADQIMAPWRTRPKKRFADFPVKISIG